MTPLTHTALRSMHMSHTLRQLTRATRTTTAYALQPALTRSFATLGVPHTVMNVFDRTVKTAQRTRAANTSDALEFEYLRDEVAKRLVDRLADISRTFNTAVDVGCNTGNLGRFLGEQGSVQKLIHIDSSEAMLTRAREFERSDPALYREARPIPPSRTHEYIHCNEEQLQLQPRSVDLVLSSMSLHWVNDLPGLFKQARTALRPDRPFLAAMLGGATLQELRSAFAVADMERHGGVMAHLSPFIKGQDCGDLLSRAGFTLPTVDTEIITCRYPDMFTLMEHLRGMGETNCVYTRPNAVSRDVFMAAASAYQELYQDEDGLIPATFQVFYLIGWSPDPSQPKAAARGSGTVKFGDVVQGATGSGCSKH